MSWIKRNLFFAIGGAVALLLLGAAAILVFVPCLGTYITSDLLGGSKTILIANLVQNQFTTARDWPFGAAVSIVLMIMAVLLLFAVRRRGEELL